MQTVPLAPASPPSRVDASTSGTTLTVSFDPLSDPANGGAAILSYDLQIDDGGGFAEVAGLSSDSLLTQHTISSLMNGNTYDLKYRAKNVHGWGPYSAVSSILLASVPDQITPAATTANNGVNVDVAWSAVASDGGSAVLEYRIKFKTASGSYEETGACDGTNAGIISAQSCSLAMTEFTSSPYSLPAGSLIVAVVEAKNIVGYSAPSTDNIAGALVQTVPATPLAAPTRGSATSTT